MITGKQLREMAATSDATFQQYLKRIEEHAIAEANLGKHSAILEDYKFGDKFKVDMTLGQPRELTPWQRLLAEKLKVFGIGLRHAPYEYTFRGENEENEPGIPPTHIGFKLEIYW